MKYSVVLVDLDGTLALNKHRYYLIDKIYGKPKWDEYFLACDKDQPNVPVITVIKSMKKCGHKIHIFSARGKIAYHKTVNWLEEHGIPYDHLTMREIDDYTPDEDLKKKWLLEHYPSYQEDIICVFDDRDKVVNMWRSLGLACFQVADGSF